MDDFEQAVETATLPTFLKQDQDAKAGGEGELEKLMGEMTDSDLDKLAGELGHGGAADEAKVGLIAPEEDQGGVAEKGKGANMTLNLGLTEGGASKEEVGEALKSAGTVDGLIAAMEKAGGKEKVD